MKMNKLTILAIDDSPEILSIIKAILSKDYNIKLATNGETGLKIAHKLQPDLILLDVVMPGLSGYATCEALKNDPKTSHIPVIMVSAMTDVRDEVVGLQAGAIDYISKPISAAILSVRVHTHISLMLARRGLEQAHSKIAQEREHLEQIVLRMRNDNEFNSKNIQFASRSEGINSGDMVLSAYRPDGSHHVMLADFTGHGLPAAIGGPLVTYIFYTRTKENMPLSEILVELNSVLKKILPVNIFMATGAVELTADRKKMEMWNFGIEDILTLDSDKNWQTFSSKGFALGISDAPSLPSHYTLNVASEQFMYLLSDGVTEASDESNENEMFGMERLQSSLISNLDKKGTMEDILDIITQYATLETDYDDMTLLEINILQDDILQDEIP